ncbi:hypothetical protein Rhe02_14510 [Rhizocola hellebori]|uniref:Uncharacterized protein n=2 Tax=Rhizocola hellebori TaxID=1392758 RepID=A0A8J3VDA3_9ACTN|nr:hypothetical protein Rhe02_14510 [Rhizocola hellebori]
MLHCAADVARMLGCSEWWVKEQARKRRIPYSFIGGSYRFTNGHVEEIVRLFERRPIESQEPAALPRQRSAQRESMATHRLTARTTRRARLATLDTAS